MKMKPAWSDMNPKAVTTDELFGYLHPATREWKDGEGDRLMLGYRRSNTMLHKGGGGGVTLRYIREEEGLHYVT